MNRTITGLFDSRAEADRAVAALGQLGFDRSGISMHASDGGMETRTTERLDDSNQGFLASLRDLFLPEEDRATYAEGIRRGGIMVSALVPEERLNEAVDAFERNGVVDVDTRSAEWRAAGWTGADAGAGYAGYSGGAALGTSGAAAGTEARRGGEEERIPLTEEQLRIGKRVASQGGVRVRTYTVETPVEQQVSLRDEHVEVERRPVDRAVAASDDAFRDRTVEATETVEEPVVDKEARVREEVVVRKTGGERTETVSDTVRRTEAEVQDERRGPKGRGPER